MARKARKQKKENKLPKLLILLGSFLLLVSLLTRFEVSKFVIAQKEKPQIAISNESPINLSIPSLNVNVNVEQGGISNEEWILSDNNALYLPTSGKLGEGYNTIIYAHNTENLFKKLKNVEEGKVIVAKDRNQKEYVYKIFHIEIIDPKDLAKLYSKEKNILTLFTCDGWADKNRLLIKARLIN
jgi:LPXTG-site transpeptidase (sortase) family protein